jgi:hypothetical protein
MSAPAHPARDTGTPGAHWQREGLSASFAERRRSMVPPQMSAAAAIEGRFVDIWTWA